MLEDYGSVSNGDFTLDLGNFEITFENVTNVDALADSFVIL